MAKILIGIIGVLGLLLVLSSSLMESTLNMVPLMSLGIGLIGACIYLFNALRNSEG